MNEERAAEYLRIKFLDEHVIEDEEQDYIDFSERVNTIAFIDNAIHNVELNHKGEIWGLPCFSCQGTGASSHYENQSPLGSGENWPMYMEDLCGDCVEKDICSKCAGHLDDCDGESDLICERCNYNASEDRYEAVPDVTE